MPRPRLTITVKPALERTLSDKLALDWIAAQLTGQEWTADDLPYIALILRRTGRAIDPPDTPDTCDSCGHERINMYGICDECSFDNTADARDERRRLNLSREAGRHDR